MNNKKKCFVIMPFSKTYKLTKEKWAEIFTHTIKPAVENCGLGYKCERYEFRRANIIKDILQEINSANIVIADLTGSNPNVLWELGVRHTLSKRTILIAQDKRFLPSDLQDYPIITYKYQQTPTEVSKFKKEISDKLKNIESEPEKADNPVADFLGIKNIDLLSYAKSANLKKLDALLSELSYNMYCADLFLDVLKKNKQARKEHKVKDVEYPIYRFTNACLEALLSTFFITPPEILLREIQGCNDFTKQVNAYSETWVISTFAREATNTRFARSFEKNLEKMLPAYKESMINLLKKINKFKTDYLNDNYQEPKESIILVASPEHEKYLELTE